MPLTMTLIAAAGSNLAPVADGARQARLMVIGLALLTIITFSFPYGYVASVLGRSQDLPAIIALCAFLLITKAGTAEWLARVPDLVRPSVPGWRLPLAGSLLLLLAAFGPEFVMGSHILSRDEQMVVFDAEVFASGQFTADVPPEWRGRLGELNVTYMRIADDQSAWISSYLPVNAAAHAIGLKLGIFALIAPLFTALGLWATWGVARRVFPDEPYLPVVAVLLYLTSSQVWLTAMTPYAMNGHLGLNMAWLWLAMGTGAKRDAAAGAVSFLAVGLHQLLFHPMFCVPFLLLMAWQGRWRGAAFHASVLLVAAIFWTVYPSLILTEGVTLGRDDGLSGIIAHGLEILFEVKPHTVGAMSGNVLRFFVWQNFAILPLLGAALVVARKAREPMILALWGALLLTPIVMTLLIPEEHHGWGYRYMHGQIGVVCLLGAAGFRALATNGQVVRGLLATGAAIAVALQFPFLTIQTARFVTPFAAASDALDATHAPIVYVEAATEPLGGDLVYNGPRLEAPIRLLPPKIAQDTD